MKQGAKWLTALLPVVYCVGMQCMVLISDASDELLFGFLGVYLLLGLFITVLHTVLFRQESPKTVATANLWITVSNLIVFLSCILLLIIRMEETRIAEENGAMEGGLGIFLLIVVYLPHWITYLLARISCAIGCARIWKGRKDGVLGDSLTVLCLIPVLDLISVIVVLRKVKHCQCFQEPPIET